MIPGFYVHGVHRRHGDPSDTTLSNFITTNLTMFL